MAPLNQTFSEAPPTNRCNQKASVFRPALNYPRLVSIALRWGSNLVHIVGADTTKFCGPKHTCLVHGMTK